MRTTIDKAGRLVIPKPLRDQVGIHSGQVEVTVDGSALRVEPVASEVLETDEDGWLVIPRSGLTFDDDAVRSLRHVGQR